MQINVVGGSSPALFNAMLFPETDFETKNWLSAQWERGSGMLTDLGRQFADRAVETWKRVYDPNLMQKVRSISRKVKGLNHPNQITHLENIDDLRSAKPVMARYIMAMPELRRLYHKQLCDGYSDAYVDNEPGLVEREHYDYRRVTHGMVTEQNETNWSSTMYIEDLHSGDRDLHFDEKSMIMDAWDLVHSAIRCKIDPTDIFGGSLEI